MTQTILELDDEALEGLVARATEAKEHDLALSPEDTQLLLDALMTLASLQERLSDKDVTLHKLRKLLEIVKSSEKLSDLLKPKDGSTDSDKKTVADKKRSKKKTKTKSICKPIKPQVVHHKLEELRKGDDCPKCDKGKLYKYEPARLLRITGSTAYTPALLLSERLRCNACGEFFTANLPEEILEDGSSDQKYGFSARSIVIEASRIGVESLAKSNDA